MRSALAPPVADSERKVSFRALWFLLAILFVLGVSFLTFAQPPDVATLLDRLNQVGAAWLPPLLTVALIVLVSKLVLMLVRRGLRFVHEPRRYVVGKFVTYVTWMAVVVVILAVFARDLSNVLVAGGLIGFGFTLVMQKPILSIAGWLWLTSRHLYRAGDRIEVGSVRGDVVDVDLLTTTLWEFGGTTRTDQPSGRLITIPNSTILEQPVFNYSKDLPFVWDEVTVPVAYEADWRFGREILLEAADEVVGNEAMRSVVAQFREVLRDTPLRYDLDEVPTVHMDPRESWIDLSVRYAVHSQKRESTRSRILERILDGFASNPDKLPPVYPRMQTQAIDDHGVPLRKA